MKINKNEQDFVLKYFQPGKLDSWKALQKVKARVGIADEEVSHAATASLRMRRIRWIAVGQSLGAGRKKLAESLACMAICLGIAVMTVMGAMMYAFAPDLMSVMTPVVEVQQLATLVLRVEAFAEPMFAASIVCYGVFVGAGDTFMPCTMNLVSIWFVRVTLAVAMATTMGLYGVWLAMAIELTFRGIVFLMRFRSGKWMHKFQKKQ